MSDITNKVLADEKVVTAAGKLRKESVEININPKQFLANYYKSEIEKIEKFDTSSLTEKEAEIVALTKQNYQKELEKAEACRLNAYLVPLKYKDLQVIKDGVLEALKYGAEFNWDDDVRMKSMIREEHTLTVYLSLRRKEDIKQRYYRSLDEIAKEPEASIDAIYSVYLENFVLSEDERKNS